MTNICKHLYFIAIFQATSVAIFAAFTNYMADACAIQDTTQKLLKRLLRLKVYNFPICKLGKKTLLK